MDSIAYKTDESEIRRMYNNFVLRIRKTKTDFIRYLMSEINWEDRFIAIRGARGCGKTTLLHQYIRLNFVPDQTIIYVSLDDVYFSNNRLIDFVDDFVSHGGTHLFIDEVHKYPSWSAELKSIYDNHSELKIVFTSSSVLNINKGSADLSRRVVVYDLDAMSFREFMNMSEGCNLEVIPLADLLKNHLSISNEIVKERKVMTAFKNYLTYGAYPFFAEGTSSYNGKLAAIVNLTLETDLPAVFNMEYRNVFKLKKLLQFLAVSGPYKPDITKLAAQLEVSRNTLLLFLSQLNSAHLLKLLKTDKGNESIMTKPEKVYLNNTNLMNALSAVTADTGSIREVFFFHQTGVKNKVTFTPHGDFLLNDILTFEVGGKNKNYSQIKNIKQSYLAIDGVETGMGNKIPLWLFGFLY